jgi:hypothetical protein
LIESFATHDEGIGKESTFRRKKKKFTDERKKVAKQRVALPVLGGYL